jgi:hypothetical protein
MNVPALCTSISWSAFSGIPLVLYDQGATFFRRAQAART